MCLSAMAAVLALLGTAAGAAPDGDAPPPRYPDRTELLEVLDDRGNLQPVLTFADWERRRSQVMSAMTEVMGPLPEKFRSLPLEAKVLEEAAEPRFLRKKVSFRADPDDLVSAYLLIPRDLPGKAPAVLCLHQTTPIGKDEPVGLGPKKDLAYARELVERGFVTLAPDYWDFGDYRARKGYSPLEHGYQSGTMKGIWNHIRSVDFLKSLPEVDGNRIGVIGHSLGGHNALFLAAFDPRIKAAVSSCGFNQFSSYAASPTGGGSIKGWAQDRYMPRIASRYGNDPKRLPFDWPEVLAVIAPRAVFVNAPLHDDNFVISGVKPCLEAARSVYRWMEAEDRLAAIHPDAAHSFPEEARQAAYRFLEKSLRPPRVEEQR
jgi:dienelactone hydrolase